MNAMKSESLPVADLSRRKNLLLFVACLAISVPLGLTWIPPWLHLALDDGRYSYLLLIPLLSLGTLYQERTRISISDGISVDGAIWVLVGFLSWALSFWFETTAGQVDRLALPTAGAVTFWVGVFRLLCGRKSWKAARFSVLFLYLMIPIPSGMLDGIVGGLQAGSAAVTNILLALSRMPFVREGLIFHFTDLSVKVAPECSGIRSSITLLLWVALQAHLSLRSIWRKLLLLLSVIPVVLFKNGLRIAMLSYLAVNIDPAFMTGWLHHKGGFVFFGVALAIEVLICRVLERSERSRPSKTNEHFTEQYLLPR
jgi:exosortase